jgi:uncharacterized membrane protein
MGKERLAAFSDGVLAIIITIMVLEIQVPQGASFAALRPLLPVMLSYVLSFVYVGIYWNNHHHLFYVTERVGGSIMWANMHLLFWLSLIPFATHWVGADYTAPVPTAVYGLVLLLASLAYWILQRTILTTHGQDSLLGTAIGRDIKGLLSPMLYALAIACAFVSPWLADSLYVLVALMWLIPDQRIEKAITDTPAAAQEGAAGSAPTKQGTMR